MAPPRTGHRATSPRLRRRRAGGRSERGSYSVPGSLTIDPAATTSRGRTGGRHWDLLPAHDLPVADAKDSRSLLARRVAAAVLAVGEDEHGGRVLAFDRDRDDPARARQEAVPQGDVGVGPQAQRTAALHEYRRTREQS